MNEIGTSNTFTIIYKNTMYMLLEKMTNQPTKQTDKHHFDRISDNFHLLFPKHKDKFYFP